MSDMPNDGKCCQSDGEYAQDSLKSAIKGVPST